MKVLFVDDDEDSVSDAMDAVRHASASTNCEYCNFGAANSKIDSWQPDIAVIDLLAGSPPAANVAGTAVCDWVWCHRFCPIIVYSAAPETLDDPRYLHPFVKPVKKGRGSDSTVADAVCEFAGSVGVIAEVRSDLRDQIAMALRDTASPIFKTYEPEKRSDALRRAARRRIAARIDDIRSDEGRLAPWEQYIFPPISEDPMLGDILMEVGKRKDDPASYLLVLTPSCDLARAGGRCPKVPNVLVAGCCPMTTVLERFNFPSANTEKLKKKLLPFLTHGFEGSIIPLPSLPGLLPAMAADMKQLSLVLPDDIGSVDSCGKKYRRVAALDSPFRELVAWAYMSTAARPGLPDRDFNSWAETIVSTVAGSGGSAAT